MMNFMYEFFNSYQVSVSIPSLSVITSPTVERNCKVGSQFPEVLRRLRGEGSAFNAASNNRLHESELTRFDAQLSRAVPPNIAKEHIT